MRPGRPAAYVQGRPAAPEEEHEATGREREKPMTERKTDESVRGRIERLVADEHRLYEHGNLDENGRARLHEIKVELDQCWDLLRQRQALRDAGRDPAEARVRPPKVVENYEQ